MIDAHRALPGTPRADCCQKRQEEARTADRGASSSETAQCRLLDRRATGVAARGRMDAVMHDGVVALRYRAMSSSRISNHRLTEAGMESAMQSSFDSTEAQEPSAQGRAGVCRKRNASRGHGSIDESQEFPREIVRKLGELGFMGMTLAGGAGGAAWPIGGRRCHRRACAGRSLGRPDRRFAQQPLHGTHHAVRQRRAEEEIRP